MTDASAHHRAREAAWVAVAMTAVACTGCVLGTILALACTLVVGPQDGELSVETKTEQQSTLELVWDEGDECWHVAAVDGQLHFHAEGP